MTRPPIEVVAGVLRDARGRVLLQQRPPGRHMAGLWEFPGGKRDRDEPPLAALRRELAEELGVEMQSAQRMLRVPWDYGDVHIALDVYEVDAYAGEPRALDGQALAWAEPGTLGGWPMPAADRPVATALILDPLYLVTPEPGADVDLFVAALDAAFARGVRLAQLRAKSLDPDALRALATRCVATASAHGAKLLLNGDAALAAALGFAGVHLSSAALRAYGRPANAHGLVAASCHDAHEIALAYAAGVDFVVLGPVRATPTHAGAAVLGIERFAELVAHCPMPCFALGGMRREDLAPVKATGAFGIAAIRALWPG